MNRILVGLFLILLTLTGCHFVYGAEPLPAAPAVAVVAPAVVSATAPVAAATSSPDYAQLVTNIITILGILIAIYKSWEAAKNARESKEENAASNKKVDEKLTTVATAVDGKMTKVEQMITDKVAAETRLDIQTEAASRKASDALAREEAAPVIATTLSTPQLEKKNGDHPDNSELILAELSGLTAAVKLLAEHINDAEKPK